MRLLITTLNLLWLSMIASDAYSQTPDKDPIWQLRWQEEFNFNIDNTKPWDAPTGLTQKRYLNNRGWTFEACHMQIDGNVRQTTDGTNLRMTNAGTLGVLKITLDKLPSPMSVIYTQDCGGNPLTPAKVVDYNYTTGYMHMSQLISQNFDMDYGFYEMKFRIPPAIQNGQHRNRGIQTNWWMCCGSQNVKTSDPDYFTEYFELDFFEISGEENRVTHNYYNARVKDKQGLPGQSGHSAAANETNFQMVNTEFAWSKWKYNSLENYAGFYKLDDLSVFKPGTETEGWHTVGVEVLPNTINWYYDGVFVQTMSNLWYSQTMRPTNSYQFLLNDNFPYIGWSEMEINTVPKEGFSARWREFGNPSTPDAGTIFPYTYEIDYLRFYKYTCKTTKPMVNITDETRPTVFLPEVYEHVELGKRGGVNDLLTGFNSVRVKDYFSATDGFEVPMGSEFYVDNCDCEP